jgi:hypothetical protein
LVKDAQGKSFILDPAEDILPYEELQKKIENFGAELSLRKGLYGDTSFMQFVTPEEYADALLSSVDPTQNKEEWKNLLEKMGLAYTEDLNQVKNYLIDSFRTEEAKTIRENIKYLNETKQQISQKELGSSYIERPADKTTASPEGTVLYNVFKNAGYGGTEDDFYNEFMPDVDRSEQQVISKAFSEKGFSLTPQDMSDPLTAFSKISDFFGETSDPFQTETTTSPKTTSSTATTSPESSYFKLFGDEEEQPLQKSGAAQSFLSGFTSFFKGFQ